MVAAQAAPDALAPRSLVFLVLGEGAEALRALHDRLDTGLLAPKLRRDIPYAPHVTIGAFPAHEEAEKAAAEIGPIDIARTVTTLELTAFDGDIVTTLCRLPLGSE